MLALQSIDKNQQPCGRAGSTFLKVGVGKYFLLGGAYRDMQQQRNVELNDCWMLHLPHNQNVQMVGLWQKLEFQNQAMYTPRSSQSACVDQEGNVYVFGGQKFAEDHSTDEFFCFNINDKIITIVEQFQRPKQRNSHSLNYYNEKKQIVMFGGANEEGPLNDLQIYDFSEKKAWDDVEEIKNFLMPREMHSAHLVNIQQPDNSKLIRNQEIDIFSQLKQEETINPAEQQNQIIDEQEKKIKSFLVLLGGRCVSTILNDIFLINLETYEVFRTGILPEPLCAFTSSLINETELIIFGGFNSTEFSKTIWVLNLLNGSIQKVLNITYLSKQETTMNEGTMASSSIYSQELNKVIIYGGSTISEEINKAYLYDLSSLQQ